MITDGCGCLSFRLKRNERRSNRCPGERQPNLGEVTNETTGDLVYDCLEISYGLQKRSIVPNGRWLLYDHLPFGTTRRGEVDGLQKAEISDC